MMPPLGPLRRRLGGWLRRYLPAEISGTITGLLAAQLAFVATGSLVAAALCGSIGEGIGYYAAIIVRDVIAYYRFHRRHTGQWRLWLTCFTCLRGLLIEFGLAEVVDSAFVRPFLLWAAPQLVGQVQLGWLIAKLAADAVFYTFAIAGYELHKRCFMRPDGGEAGPPTPAEPSSLLRPVPLSPAALAHLDHPTPYLVMDLGTIARQYERFRTLLPDVAVHYAVKCNPDPRVAAYLHSLGSNFEIASADELHMLTAHGVPPSDVIYSNPVRPAAHIQAAVRAGIDRFAVDSESELGKLARHAPGARVYVRLATVPANSKVPSEGKFGVAARDAASLLHRAAGLGLCPYGLAFHVGSQMQNPVEFSAAIERAGRLMGQLRDAGIILRFLDMGGGFPAHYQDDAPNLADHAAAINESLARHLPYRVDLAIEPGRALVGNAGVMVTRVIGVTDRVGRRWVHVDAGAFNGFMESLETRNQLLFPLDDSRASARKGTFNLTGPSCDSQDTIMFDTELSDDIGLDDLVYVYAAGAYTTGYASRFNGFDIPQTYCLPAPDSGRGHRLLATVGAH